jgi:hypothetical protein
LNAQEIVTQLTELTTELKTTVTELADLDELAVRAEWKERQAYAQAFMSMNGSMEIRKQQSILDTSGLTLERELADMRVRAAKARIKYLEVAFDAIRSISAARRAEFASEATGQYT